jgi:Rrf2 family protein
MKRTTRLSVALHVLVHLAERSAGPRTSGELARCVGTNAVVIRRTLAGLRERGLVRSVAGPGGGWSLDREPPEISLAEVSAALGERLLFAIDLGSPAGCPVQGAVAGVMEGVLRDAEELLRERLARISLAELAGQVRREAWSDHT